MDIFTDFISLRIVKCTKAVQWQNILLYVLLFSGRGATHRQTMTCLLALIYYFGSPQIGFKYLEQVRNVISITFRTKNVAGHFSFRAFLGPKSTIEV